MKKFMTSALTVFLALGAIILAAFLVIGRIALVLLVPILIVLALIKYVF